VYQRKLKRSGPDSCQKEKEAKAAKLKLVKSIKISKDVMWKNLCAQCGISSDTAEHAFFQCDAWHHWRVEACVYLGVDELSPDNINQIMWTQKLPGRGYPESGFQNLDFRIWIPDSSAEL